MRWLSVVLLLGCTGTVEGGSDPDAGSTRLDAGGRTDAGTGIDATTRDAATALDAGTDAGPPDAGPPDPCADAAFCETFEGYTETTLDDGQRFGPWRAALRTPGGAMDLDGAHTVSGDRALHIRIETGETAGGRLFTTGTVPLLESTPTHLYGRMMMYIDPNGSSVHWTFFGASGDAEPSSPVTGRRATYLVSSLPRSDVNTFSFVDGLAPSGGDPYHDCWFQSMEAMPTARWVCVELDMDSVARRLRLYLDGATDPSVAVDDHGQGCVGDVVPDDSPWYGPAVDEMYVGAWSFHDMVAPLEVWIDDLVVDTSPVHCPAP